MSATIIECVQGDITREAVDCIVNAANAHLAGGGGVDGAIHRAGGPEIMRELREKYDGCPTGSAVITGAGRLKAKFVIHAVGPRWKEGRHDEAALLAGAYQKSLELALAHGCKTISFPAISCGVYGYPKAQAAAVAMKTVHEFVKKNPCFEKIRFVLFDAETLKIFQEALTSEKQHFK